MRSLEICLVYQFIFAFLPHLQESLIYKSTWHATAAAQNYLETFNSFQTATTVLRVYLLTDCSIDGPCSPIFTALALNLVV